MMKCSFRAVRKRHLLLVLCILSTTFLFTQLTLFQSTLTHKQRSGDVKDNVDDENINLRDASTSYSYKTVERFMEVCHEHGLPVFLIDPLVLSSITVKQLTDTNCTAGQNCLSTTCHHLCTGQRLTSFGVFGHLWRPQPKAFEDFRLRSFKVTNATIADTPLGLTLSAESDSSCLPSYYLFELGARHTVHLVLFYLRNKSYLWHDAHGDLAADIEREIPEDVGKSPRLFGETAGAYDNFDVIKVTVDGVRLRAVKQPASFLRQIPSAQFLECNHSRAARFFREHKPRDTDAEAVQFFTDALDVLRIVKEVLDRLGVPFWISSGTCLGWFRQCDLISYSNDVDIGVWIKDYDERVISSLEDSGLVLLHLFGKVQDSFELSFSGNNVKLDIFFFYEDSTYVWNGGTQARTGKKFKYIFPKFSLCWTELLTLRVRVPCDTRSYIEANYGENWFEPVTSWDWKKSPPNVHENGAWPKEEWDKVIVTYQR